MSWRPVRAACLLGAVLLQGGAAVGAAEEATPVLVQSAPGRFEIAARDPSAAHGVATLAEETWRLLEGPFGLPQGFASPVFVRLIEERRSPLFMVEAEPGGIVSLRIRWVRGEEPPPRTVREALVSGLIVRRAVAAHGAMARAGVPAWLSLGAAGWCETRADPAYADAVKYRSERSAVPELAQVLSATAAPEALELGSLWLFTLLQAETTRAAEWPAFLAKISQGEPSEKALDEIYPGRFESPEDRELWWQTGWHQLRRVRTLPGLDALESRLELAALARFVFAPGESDRVTPLRAILDPRRNVIVGVELRRRSAELARLLPLLHPFYRNAGLSLSTAFESVGLSPIRRDEACAQFDADWADAVALETASRAALDALEQRR